MPVDPVQLSCELIRRPSVTPADAGAMDIVERELAALGFACRRMRFGQIENLYARRGAQGPNLCYAGHTDVVPVGEAGDWSVDPFEAALKDGVLVGRGAVDMKSSIAAFIAAASRYLDGADPRGSISLLITGDEEGDAVDGTKKVVEALMAEGERIDHCVVGEPTSSASFGDMVKIGRRGSLNATITVEGKQGHVAYPHRAANPVPVLVRLLARLSDHVLDDGYTAFQPSNLEVVTVDVGNTASNVIPAKATAKLNIRFNPAHTGASLSAWLREECARANDGFSGRVDIAVKVSGEAFLTERGDFTDLVAAAITEASGAVPELSTTGGTSDARFIRSMCPVVEFGLVGATMHAVDERAPVAEIETLARVYERLITRYFERFA
jgi:succinyl-diaminopimelate desuccinylase